MYFEATANVRLILTACERAGVAPQRVLEEAKFDTKWLSPLSLHVPWQEVERLLAAAERLTGNPCIGLHAAAEVTAAHFGMAVHYTLNQPTYRRAIELGWQAMGSTWSNLWRLSIVDDTTLGMLRFETAPVDSAAIRHVLDYHMMIIVRGMVLTPYPKPRAVRLRRAENGLARFYERAFDCPVAFGQDHDEVVVPIAMMDEPFLRYDPGLNTILRPYFDAHIQAMKNDLGMTFAVTNLLEAEMVTGRAPSLIGIAGKLHLSARTVTARLAEEGTSFRRLTDEVRSRRAFVLLRVPDAKVETVALQLGFSGVAPFVRAFRRWTGDTPDHWRRKQTAA